VVEPAAIVSVPAESGATVEFDVLSVTVIPPVGAGDASVTVPTLWLPPRTVVGLSVSVNDTGLMVSDTWFVVNPAYVAVVFAVLTCDTLFVVIE